LVGHARSIIRPSRAECKPGRDALARIPARSLKG
jgi:hypothetical protein